MNKLEAKIKNSFFLFKSAKTPEIGFTTGTCAAAASVAAARMLVSQKILPYVILTTPKGIKVFIEIENQKITKTFASCSVRKISGDDPDVTDGIEIFSKVSFFEKSRCHFEPAGKSIIITGGKGVGRVTLPGLDQKVGEYAINSVPRKMILEGVEKESDKSILVEISVPEGEEIAKKTFNPKLGIVGGISILGTSGIVEPMSEQALLDTIKVEINVRKSQGFRILTMVPGNYGSDFLKSEFGINVETAVHCSNFVYDALKMAEEAGFRKILFCGHIGKLIKVARGRKNTHSKFGDGRMQGLFECAKDFFPNESLENLKKELEGCISTEQAIKVLDIFDKKSEGKEENHNRRAKIMREVAKRIQKQMTDWTNGKIEIEVIIFTKESGLLSHFPSLSFCSQNLRQSS